MSHKKFVIVGLRAIHPTILGDHLPGYFGQALSTQRYSFTLSKSDRFYAWYSNPFFAEKFDSEAEALEIVALLIAYDCGTFRPLIVLPIYL